MKRILLAALLIPAAVFAAPPSTDVAPPEESGQRMEKMAEVLKLDSAQAQKLKVAMQPFMARKRAIREQVKTARQTLRSAAEGDAAALAKVDAAEGQLLDARSAQLALQKEMVQSVGQSLSPQQRAKLDLFLTRNFGGSHARGHGGRWKGGQGE